MFYLYGRDNQTVVRSISSKNLSYLINKAITEGWHCWEVEKGGNPKMYQKGKIVAHDSPYLHNKYVYSEYQNNVVPKLGETRKQQKKRIGY